MRENQTYAKAITDKGKIVTLTKETMKKKFNVLTDAEIITKE